MGEEHAPEPSDAAELAAQASESSESVRADDELPVVARMVVEIRSDGTRTVARGAVEDLLHGEQVAVEARAGSPLELSRALAKMLLSAPFAASSALLRGEQDAREGARITRGLRGRMRALGRDLGSRLEREVQARLLGDDDVS